VTVTFVLADLIAKRGLTQSEVARKAGLSFQAVNHLCSGRAQAVTFDTLDRLAKALNIAPGQLFEFKRR
jgi:putative transcriptional regulator